MRLLLSFGAILALGACGPSPEAEFLGRIEALCGQAFEGQVVSDDPEDDDWRAERLVMHVRECGADDYKIALHVGDDHSRTWILRREDGKLALRHDHRHEDGTPSAAAQYGGFAADYISGSRAEFPADQISKDLFDAEGIPVSKQNTWAIEVRPVSNLFAYEMWRPAEGDPTRFIRAEFDTSKPVETPPAPWGYEDSH